MEWSRDIFEIAEFITVLGLIKTGINELGEVRYLVSNIALVNKKTWRCLLGINRTSSRDIVKSPCNRNGPNADGRTFMKNICERNQCKTL